MKRIIDAARGLFAEATGTVRKGRALVVACAVGAMIAGAFVVSTPSPGLTDAGNHSWGNCNQNGGHSYCNWMCQITGHYGGQCNAGPCKCHC